MSQKENTNIEDEKFEEQFIMKMNKKDFLELLEKEEIKLIGKYEIFSVYFINIYRIYFTWREDIYCFHSIVQKRIIWGHEYHIRIVDGIDLKNIKPSSRINRESSNLMLEINQRIDDQDYFIYYDKVEKEIIELSYSEAKMLSELRSSANCRYLSIFIYNNSHIYNKIFFIDKANMNVYWFDKSHIEQRIDGQTQNISAPSFPHGYKEEDLEMQNKETTDLLYRLKKGNSKGIYDLNYKSVSLGLLANLKKISFHIDDDHKYGEADNQIKQALMSDDFNLTFNNEMRNTSFQSMLFDGKRFISIFSDGWIRFSEDGLAWAIVKTNLLVNMKGIAYNGEVFIGATKSALFKSKDCIIWEKILDTEFILTSIKWINGFFVCLGGWSSATSKLSGAVMVSRNGQQWQRVLEGENCRWMMNICWDGSFYYIGNERGLIFKSENLIDWDFIDKMSLKGSHDFVFVIDMISNNGVTLAAGTNVGSSNVSGFSNTYILRSIDGRVFEEVKKLNKVLIKTFCLIDDVFFACCEKGRIFSSKDGLKWKGISVDSEDAIVKIIKTDELFISYTEAGAIYTSRDLKEWVIHTEKIYIDIGVIVQFEGKLLLAGGNNKFYNKDDSKRRIFALDNTGKLHRWEGKGGDITDIAVGKNICVAVSLGGSIFVSKNGLDWNTVRQSDEQTYYSSVCYSPFGFIANLCFREIYLSKDGLQWEDIAEKLPKDRRVIYRFITDGKETIMLSSEGIYQTYDGTVWNKVIAYDRNKLEIRNGFRNGDKWVLYGKGIYELHQAKLKLLHNKNFDQIVNYQNKYVAIKSREILSSNDLKIWDKNYSLDDSILKCLYVDNNLVIGGNGGLLCYLLKRNITI